MKRSKWDQRIRRADALAGEYPFAAEVLRFYSQVTRLQKDLYAGLQPAGDWNTLLPRFPDFLREVSIAAPAPLAQCARDVREYEPAQRFDLLHAFWSDAARFQPEPGRTPELLACMFLQPYAEFLAERAEPLPEHETYGTCPNCRARPVAAALRQEGDGGKRSLICGLCATEWNIGRLVCAACGEESIEKLAVYTAEQFPHIRVDACDTCRYYLKTIDLTRNGNAIPVVDEIAAIPLDLWAQQHQYVKLRANLLGI